MKLRTLTAAALSFASLAMTACQKSDAADASLSGGVPPGEVQPPILPDELVGCEEHLKTAELLDSRLFAAIEVDADTLDAASARKAVQAAATLAGCEDEEVGHLFEEGGQAACRTLLRGKPDSTVCYVESDYGTFVVSPGAVQGFNVLFNRFD
jgi:hypothetical protein